MRIMAKLAASLLVVSVISLLVSAEDANPQQEEVLSSLSEDSKDQERNFDTGAWQGVPYAIEPQVQLSDVDIPWQSDDVTQEPPRRRRPGRRRKKRPHHPPPSDVESDPSNPENIDTQGSVRYSIDSGIQVAYADEDQRPRQRKPQRVSANAENDGERPHRRRGHKRRQRPYLPNIETGPTSLAGENKEVKNEEISEDYKVAPFIEQINHELRDRQRGDKEIERLPSAEGPSASEGETFAELEANIEQQVDKPNLSKTKEREIIKNDKSYRKPYSQAKKEETEEISMAGASADLKALLKQSGGLSLSEVLQQRNLSLTDLLTGKQNAITALKTNGPVNLNAIQTVIKDQTIIDDKIAGTNQSNTDNNENKNEDERPRRRLPPPNKSTRGKVERERGNKYTGSRDENNHRRRLPPASRRQKIENNLKEKIEEASEETTTVINSFKPSKQIKTINENVIRQQPEDQVPDESTEIPTNYKDLEDDAEAEVETITTTTEFPTTTFITTTRKTFDDSKNRLSLKPRLRLPAVKTIPRRISHPDIKPKIETENPQRPKFVKENKDIESETSTKTAKLPPKAFQINVKDIFGMSDIMQAANIITKTKPDPTTSTTETPTTTIRVSTSNYRAITRSSSKKTDVKPTKPPSAKEEILEVLTDAREGERLAKVLAERNMTLKELVEHRERGSSQVHLADIFTNSSKESNPGEPFLAKSVIGQISKETYPLKALLEGNLRERPILAEETHRTTTIPPAPFIDFSKTSNNEENLGIVTLFDKFSKIAGHPKIFDPKIDIKKDSDGSSYFTSVINVKPTDEIYRESRGSGFQNSHKQMSEIFSSIPTYIKSDDIVDARVIQDWSKIPQRQNIYIPVHNGIDKNHHVDRDLDGDGLIVLDDLQRNDEFDDVEAANLGYDTPNDRDYDQDRGFYHKLPAGMRSAIVMSSAIVGTSLVVFLAIFVACRWRQKRRNLLRYDESFNGSRVRSPILNRKISKNNSSSRSISPILLNGETIYKNQNQNQKVNTMDSQTQRDAQDYLWDSLRKPFQ